MENILIDLFERGETPFFLVCDGITDVRNFGAIARSASCSGVHAIIVPEKGSAIISGDAVKTSAGALHELPVCRVKSLETAVNYMQNSGLQIVCATEKGKDLYYENNYTGPLAIVMGAEDTGISEPLLRKADVLCQIPIQGPIKSLNVSVAAGILMFEVVRQRHLGVIV
jgi:23S rRNA (guanosine2251-2'-O)-methyltransferase